LEIAAEAGDEHCGEVGGGVLIDRPDNFCGMPAGADFTGWVACLEQPNELGAAGVGQSFVGSGQLRS